MNAMRPYIDILKEATRLSEMIRHRDRVEGSIVAVNPSQAEFKANFKRAAGGVLTKSGDFVVGEADHSMTHPDILILAGFDISQDRYHLAVWPTYVIVELWDNLDDVGDVPLDKNGMITPKVFAQYTRYPKKFRDQAGHAVRSNKHIHRAYGGVFKVYVDVYSPELSSHPMNGRMIRDRY